MHDTLKINTLLGYFYVLFLAVEFVIQHQQYLIIFLNQIYGISKDFYPFPCPTATRDKDFI
jgi:hypothetical protein